MAYISLSDLETYKLTRRYSVNGWGIYEGLSYQNRKIIGDQFMQSIDSVGANIAEGYGRYHYLDKCKFYYNARGSLFESKHWIELLYERKLITKVQAEDLLQITTAISITLNKLIASTKNHKTCA
jgi:four helix bundle protein